MDAAINLLTSYAASSSAVRSRSNAHPPLPCVFFLPLRSTLARSYGIRLLPPLLCRHSLRRMATENSAARSRSLTELNTASDFDCLVTPEGYISICGFGSLLSERSARSTFPDLKNFRSGVLRGFRRVFAHLAPIFFERGIANEETGEVSSLSVERCEGEFLIVTVFEIRKEEVPAFIERENEFRFLSFRWFLKDWMELLFQIQRWCVLITVTKSTFKYDAKVARIYITSIMDNTTYIRYGEMIYYLVGRILDIVFWQRKISEKQLTTTSWITPTSRIVKQLSGSTWPQPDRASWKKSHPNC